MQINFQSARIFEIAFPAAYLAILSVFCVLYNVSPGPEFLVISFSIYAVYRKWTRRFVRDWIPFTALFLAYEAMYGVVDNISGIVHVNELISVESRVFGAIPTLLLQQFYRNTVFDHAGAVLYSLHFMLPTIFGFVLWKYSPRNYWRYTIAFLLCSYGALVTFLMFPSAPPWLGVKASRVLLQVDQDMGIPVYHTIFDYIQPNPYAAFPSLHAAYPWLISLYAIKIKRMKALPILVIPLGIWLSAVYLGEHYVIDLLGGVAYATCAFLIVEKLVPRLPF